MDQAAVLIDFPQTAEDRMRLALRRLDTALSEQAAAVAEFRSNISALRTAVGSLRGQMENYQTVLDATAVKLRHTHDAARALERTADKMAALA